MLLKAGASVDCVNAGKMTPLILAAASGQRACVELVLRSGAPLEAEDEHGRRALHYAAAAGADGCVDALVFAGADIFARDRAGAMPSDAARREAPPGPGSDAALAMLEDAMVGIYCSPRHMMSFNSINEGSRERPTE
jgi:ankyrin repeat protein